MIIDTDVLIWFFRGDAQAKKALNEIVPDKRFVSVVSYMELLQGMRNKTELVEFKKLFEASEFIMLPLNPDTGNIACQYLERFALQTGLRLGDALVAATALSYGETIFTGNFKHFKALGISLKQFARLEQT